jgi:hypothetical protein
MERKFSVIVQYLQNFVVEKKRLKTAKLVTMYKIHNDEVPQYLKETIPRKVKNTSSYNLRNGDNYNSKMQT